LAQDGDTENNFLYTGEQFDPNIGFYYLRARYYEQGVGRFTTVDPFVGFICDPYSLHKYVYAYANPANASDPSGRMTVYQMMVTNAIIGTLAGTGIGYYLDGTAGAVIGAAAGAGLGWYATSYFALEFLVYVPAAMNIVRTWFLPTSKFLKGPNGRILFSELSKVENTRIVELYSNLSRQVEFTRSIHMANTKELAAAGGRAMYNTFVFRIPSGIITKLEQIGLVETTITMEEETQAIEYHFLPDASAYISKFLVK